MAEVDHLSAVVKALGLGRLAHLVADGVEDDGRVVEVALHHTRHVRFPALFKIAAVIVGVLAVVPHVKGLVHHVHAEPVAGLQHGFRCRVVGRADGVEAVFLQDAHAPLLALGIGRRAQDAAVVVDAAAAQQGFLSVDEKALVRPGDFPDTKGDFDRIALARRDFCGIEIGRLVAPELCVGDRQFKARALAADTLDLRLDRDRAFDLHHGRVNRHGGDLHALGAQPALFADVQPNRPIDARAGVPAGVGQLGVVRDHRQRVLRAVNETLQLHEEAGVAVGVEAKLFAVQADGRVFIHALELQEDVLVFPLCRSGEGLFIGIDAAGEISVASVGYVRAAAFGNLRVVGQRDAFAAQGPVFVE